MRIRFVSVLLLLCFWLTAPVFAQDSSKLEKVEEKRDHSERKEKRLRKKAEKKERKLARQEKKTNRRQKKVDKEQRKLEKAQDSPSTSIPMLEPYLSKEALAVRTRRLQTSTSV
jgi:predicted  nucleic acid-binding Zn-ribbon protein